MRVRASLFARILFWSFLNLAVVGAVPAALFSLQYRLGPESPLFVGDRLEPALARLLAELRAAVPSERNAIVERYSTSHRVDFLLFDERGVQTAGTPTRLPSDVAAFVGAGDPGRGSESKKHSSVFRQRTAAPTRYWVGLKTEFHLAGEHLPERVALVVVSDSMSGHGLFFDVRPWLFVVSAIVLLSALIWFPFVRSLTGSIRQMTSATERIASGRFDGRIDASRSDELGRLGEAINQLSARLAGFVGGQRRFLGDISHELNSPLARLDVALGILEERLVEADRHLVDDAQEEVRLMSQLVAELLAFAKASMEGPEVRLTNVRVRPIVEAIVAREAADRGEVTVDVEATLEARAQPQLLARALANVIRNAVRYAGHAGPIVVSACQEADRVIIAVVDGGPGVPAGALPRLFDPFYRIEADRDRATGGAGLGLAIVKTCVEACRGSVGARNVSPTGFEVRMVLPSATGA